MMKHMMTIPLLSIVCVVGALLWLLPLVQLIWYKLEPVLTAQE